MSLPVGRPAGVRSIVLFNGELLSVAKRRAARRVALRAILARHRKEYEEQYTLELMRYVEWSGPDA